MLKSSWRLIPRATAMHGFYVAKPSGRGAVRRPKFTGRHKFMKRTEREALCRKLEG